MNTSIQLGGDRVQAAAAILLVFLATAVLVPFSSWALGVMLWNMGRALRLRPTVGGPEWLSMIISAEAREEGKR